MSMGAVHVPGVVSANVSDSINTIFVGGLPLYLNEEQVWELLKSFGELKVFHPVRENEVRPSKVRFRLLVTTYSIHCTNLRI